MTPEMAKRWLPIIQAVAEGKMLQVRTVIFADDMGVSGGRWQDCPSDGLLEPPLGAPENYRIKPEPREFWIDMLGVVSTFPVEGLIHVREVIDE